MNLRKVRQFIPLGIIAFFATFSFLGALFGGFIYDFRQYIGLTLLLISILMFLGRSRYYEVFFGITLTLATFTPISFTAITFDYFSIIAFPMLLIHCFLCRDALLGFIYTFFSESEEDIKKSKQRKVELFKSNFSDLSIEEIDDKLNQDLVVEAKTALQQLKQEKQ